MSTAVYAPSSSASLPARPATVPAATRRGAWQICAGQAISLKASSNSIMRIRQGRVWVTLDANRAHGSEDIVLAPGESLKVAAGERLVMEPWDGYGATYTWDVA
ncbi:DUF2917 domain-containing protein [Variovorax robiniae]|uniref:DUF2917 domain-containing protein n=1 Tax=Variovorax robiniae TaxID=1836199 RepID=A0ABU8X412_9BURK